MTCRILANPIRIDRSLQDIIPGTCGGVEGFDRVAGVLIDIGDSGVCSRTGRKTVQEREPGGLIDGHRGYEPMSILLCRAPKTKHPNKRFGSLRL